MRRGDRAGWVVATLLAAALSSFTRPARALDLGSEDSMASVEVHAFASQGFILSKDNDYLSADTTHGSFQFSELGVNLTKKLTDRFRVGLQLFAQDLGPTGNYDVRADWFYLDYRFTNWLGVRAGRVKIPFGLYNDSVDIDSARAAVLLPQSVYPEENRNYLLAQTGGEVYGFVDLRKAGGLDYSLYGGTIYVDETTPAGSPYQITNFNVPYVGGGRLLWDTPVDGLRVGGSVQALRLDASILANIASPTAPATPVTANIQIPAVLWVGSAEYTAGDLVLSAEYSRWMVSEDTSNPSVIPVQATVTSERAYVMATYRATPWLQPCVYYAVTFPDVTQRDGRQNYQHDVSTTLRFDLNSFWLLKLEGHYMVGTGGVDPTLNGGASLASLTPAWGVLLVKTTAYF
ncbi:MAG TPA: hypothetical protein VIY73_02195 [Polyangiaceae bacterium]